MMKRKQNIIDGQTDLVSYRADVRRSSKRKLKKKDIITKKNKNFIFIYSVYMYTFLVTRLNRQID